jgi:hypothetical protein
MDYNQIIMKHTILFAGAATSIMVVLGTFSVAGAADASTYRLVFTAPGSNQRVATPVKGGFMYSDYSSSALTSDF